MIQTHFTAVIIQVMMITLECFRTCSLRFWIAFSACVWCSWSAVYLLSRSANCFFNSAQSLCVSLAVRVSFAEFGIPTFKASTPGLLSWRFSDDVSCDTVSCDTDGVSCELTRGGFPLSDDAWSSSAGLSTSSLLDVGSGCVLSPGGFRCFGPIFKVMYALIRKHAVNEMVNADLWLGKALAQHLASAPSIHLHGFVQNRILQSEPAR